MPSLQSQHISKPSISPAIGAIDAISYAQQSPTYAMTRRPKRDARNTRQGPDMPSDNSEQGQRDEDEDPGGRQSRTLLCVTISGVSTQP